MAFIPSIGVDACIIEEQPDHLVLAIRVPKATIIDSAALLAAVVECSGVEDQGVWSTRADPPSEAEDQEDKPDLESLLLQLVSAAPLMQLAFDKAIKHPCDMAASDSLAFSVSTVVDIANDLHDLEPMTGRTLFKAVLLMQERSGYVLEGSEDTKNWDTLQLSISEVTKLATAWDVATGSAYDATWGKPSLAA
jgi:hypothetical protein